MKIVMPEIREKVVFRYKRLPFMIAWVVIVTGLLAFLAIQALRQKGMTAGLVIFFVSAFAIIYWQGFLVVFGASDIIINNDGVSRILFGMTWKKISWENMARIVCFEVYYSRWHTNVMVYNLFPKIKPKVRLFPSGKMWITGNFKDVNKMRNLMNEFVLEYGIPVQCKQNGNIIIVDKLRGCPR